MTQGAVRLSATTFELVWRYLRLGELPTPLFVPPTVAKQREAIEELGEADLLAGREDLDGHLVGLLRLLARPADEFYGWFVRANGSAYSGVVAVHQGKAALAVLEDDRLYLTPIPANTPAQSLLGIAPRRPPVAAKSITVPVAEFGPPPGARGRHADFAPARGVLADDVDVARLQALVSGPDQGRGQLFVAVRDPAGRRRKSVRPVYYLDTDEGRWLLEYTVRHGGEPWLTAAPGAPQALTHALYQARRELIGQR